MYSEFKGVWLRCIKRYDWRAKMRPARDTSGTILLDDNGQQKMVNKKTTFNTYLYTSMKHRVCNIIKRRHSKRLLDGNGKPVVETMLSLDYVFGNGEGDMTLKDK